MKRSLTLALLLGVSLFLFGCTTAAQATPEPTLKASVTISATPESTVTLEPMNGENSGTAGGTHSCKVCEFGEDYRCVPASTNCEAPDDQAVGAACAYIAAEEGPASCQYYVLHPISCPVTTDANGVDRVPANCIQPQNSESQETTATPTATPTTGGTTEKHVASVNADDSGFAKTEMSFIRGFPVELTFHVDGQNVYFGGLQIKCPAISYDSGKIAPGGSTTAFFTMPQSSFTCTAFWPASGVKKGDLTINMIPEGHPA